VRLIDKKGGKRLRDGIAGRPPYLAPASVHEDEVDLNDCDAVTTDGSGGISGKNGCDSDAEGKGGHGNW